jgi:hypothetical protein
MNTVDSKNWSLQGVICLSSKSVSPRVKEAILRTMNWWNEPWDDIIMNWLPVSKSGDVSSAILDESFFN